MPFKSAKQRRYLHANHPKIAKRWEAEYGVKPKLKKKKKKKEKVPHYTKRKLFKGKTHKMPNGSLHKK